jgi:predicted CXXCH cytochrome family protein
MLQASRQRLNNEVARKAVRGARCTRCHRPILESSSTGFLVVRRRLRVCVDCVPDEDE